jgi:hypothetical protein
VYKGVDTKRKTLITRQVIDINNEETLNENDNKLQNDKNYTVPEKSNNSKLIITTKKQYRNDNKP